jgi:hypothetical protein
MPAQSDKLEAALAAKGLPEGVIKMENEKGKKFSVVTTRAPTAKSLAQGLEDWLRAAQGDLMQNEQNELMNELWEKKHGSVVVGNKEDWLRELAAKAAQPPVAGKVAGAPKPPPVCSAGCLAAIRHVVRKVRKGFPVSQSDIDQIEVGLQELDNVAKPRAVRLLAAVLDKVGLPPGVGQPTAEAVAGSRPTGTDKKEYGPIFEHVMSQVGFIMIKVTGELQDDSQQQIQDLAQEQKKMKRHLARIGGHEVATPFLKITPVDRSDPEKNEEVYDTIITFVMQNVGGLKSKLLVRNEDFEVGEIYLECADSTDATWLLMNWPDASLEGSLGSAASTAAMPPASVGISTEDLLA